MNRVFGKFDKSLHFVLCGALALVAVLIFSWLVRGRLDYTPVRRLKFGMEQADLSGSRTNSGGAVTISQYAQGSQISVEGEEGLGLLPNRIVSGVVLPNSISQGELSTFKPISYPLGRPAYDGEPVTAYVRVGSLGRDIALTVNQGGEFQRVPVRPSETVEVRLAFTRTPPGTTVALNAEDGGGVRVDGGRGRSVIGTVDDQRQLGFSFRVTGTAGVHRVTVRVPSGETKVLEFWAGEAPPQKKP